MQWSLLPLIIAGVVSGPVDESVKTIAVDKPSKTLDVDKAAGEREEKLFSVFQIVKFNNEQCTGSSGNSGICFTAAECSSYSGTAEGTCASGFGVCCVNNLNPCEGTTRFPNVVLEYDVANPGTCTTDNTDSSESGSKRSLGRQGRQTGMQEYDYRIERWTTAIVQMRLDFELFEIMPPSNGECTNDTLLFEHLDSNTQQIVPTNLCGTLTGSHMYLDFTENNYIDIRIILAQAIAQRWRIRVRQLEATDDLYAPRGCLQYFDTTSTETGTFMTFNHDSGNGELLNNHGYTVCIEQKVGFCDVALTSSMFDLKGKTGTCSDTVAFGTTCLCGNTFANAGTLTWNYTGPYNVGVMTAGDNSAMAVGFEINFMLLPC